MPAYPMKQEAPRVEFWRAPDLKAELLQGRFLGFSYEVHTHATACFSVLTHGSIRIKMKAGEFTARRGDLYAIEADEAHAGWPLDNDGWALRTLYVDTAYLGSLLGVKKTGAGLDPKGPLIQDPALVTALYAVHRCSQLGGSNLYRAERYLEFAARLFQRHMGRTDHPAGAVGAEPRAIRIAKEYIDGRLDTNVNLADIATAANIPLFRLYRAFQRATGMTPHGYQRQARIRLAIDLIRANTPLGAAAVSTGFSDQAHLTRWFRRTMGITPGAFQKAMQA